MVKPLAVASSNSDKSFAALLCRERVADLDRNLSKPLVVRLNFSLRRAVVRKPAQQAGQFCSAFSRTRPSVTPIAASIARAISMPSALGRLGGSS